MGPLREPVEETLLCGMAGYADAVGYLTLGAIFAANMTGNTVLLGIALATGDARAIAAHGAAIAAFFAGALTGRALGLVGPTRAPLLLLEAALLALLVVVPVPTLAKLALLALAMGIQASARVRVGEVDLPSVVVTTTLARLARRLVDLVAKRQAGEGGDPREAVLPYALAWLAYGVGAAVGALGVRTMERPLLVPLIVLLPLAALELLSWRRACSSGGRGGKMPAPQRGSDP